MCVGKWRGYSALFPLPPRDIKANSDSGGLWHPGPLSMKETKHQAASLHHIKQSLNASSCYTLPSEIFMKGPLMRFQKHLVISPRAWRGLNIWMNCFLALQRVDSMIAGVPTVLQPNMFLSLILAVVSFTEKFSNKHRLSINRKENSCVLLKLRCELPSAFQRYFMHFFPVVIQH